MIRRLSLVALACSLVLASAVQAQDLSSVDAADAVEADLAALERNADMIRELAGMGALDQAVRLRFLEARRTATDERRAELEAFASEIIDRIDEAHEARLKTILAGHAGWFPISAFGERAATGAYQVTQHSSDLDLQRDVLSRMEPYLGTDEIDASDYAKLFDRLALAEGRQQRYATQGTKCADGVYVVPDDVEDPAGLERRRSDAGLVPMSAYLEGLNQMYGRCSASSGGR